MVALDDGMHLLAAHPVDVIALDRLRADRQEDE